ncbi:MAG: diguanylate cyclase [Burkholderiales bacterium]|nr:diguanylate cyclase [Burkholderiales bacterium]
MTVRKIHGHPVLILGAGRGGSALLEMFLEDELVEVVAVADPNPEAPGIILAQSQGIPAYLDVGEAALACKDYSDCIVYNLTHDDSVIETVGKVFGNKKVTSGPEAMLFWQMVTNLKRIRGELEKSQDQLKAIIHHVMDGIITVNESAEIQGFNPAAEKIFGYSQKDVLGKNVSILMPSPYRSEHDAYISRYLQTGQGRIVGMHGREVMATRKDGEQFPAELSISEMALGGQRYFIGIVRDITERKAAEQKIVHLAHHDYLTGLPNRVLFLDRLEQAIAHARRAGCKVALLFLDLDGFKRVNDELGHDVGDMLLQEVARRLADIVRASDTVARVGGDEFTLILGNVAAQEFASQVAGKIIDALSEPFDMEGRQCQVGGSIGVSIFPDDSEDPGTLLKQSDEAMYLAKQRGKNRHKLYADVPKEAALS